MALLYIMGAQLYLSKDNKEKALEFLKKYVDLCVDEFFPLYPHGDEHYDAIDEWLLSQSLGSSLPRNEDVIKQSMLNDVLLGAQFAALADEPAYQKLVKKMKAFVEGS